MLVKVELGLHEGAFLAELTVNEKVPVLEIRDTKVALRALADGDTQIILDI